MDTSKVFVVPLSILLENNSRILSGELVEVNFKSREFRLALVYRKSKTKYLDIVTGAIYKKGVSLKSRVGDIVINPFLYRVPLNEIEYTKRQLSRKEIISRYSNDEFYDKAKQKILSYEYFDWKE